MDATVVRFFGFEEEAAPVALRTQVAAPHTVDRAGEGAYIVAAEASICVQDAVEKQNKKFHSNSSKKSRMRPNMRAGAPCATGAWNAYNSPRTTV